MVDAVHRFKDERAEMEATIKELQLMVQEQVGPLLILHC